MNGNSLGDIVVRLKADVSNLEAGLTKAGAGVDTLGKKVNSTSFTSFASNASSAFGGIADGIQNAVTKFALLAAASTYGGSRFIKLAGDLQTTQQQMVALSGSTEEAQRIMGELYQYVLGKPIEFPTASKAAQTLMGYGVATKDVIGAMKTLSAFTVVNGADMSQLALAYGQVNAKGRLMGQEIIQLTNNFVPVSQVIAKHFNVSLQDAQALMEGGKVSAQEFNQAMAEFIPQEKIAEQSNTFKNRMISLQGTIRAFGLALIGVKVDPKLGLVVEPGGLFDKLSNYLPKISADLKELRPRIQAVINWLINNGPTVKAAILAIAAAFIVAKVAAIGFAIAAAINPFTLIAAAITVLVAAIVFLQVRFHLFTNIYKDFLAFVKQGWSDIKQWASDTGEFIIRIFNDVKNFLAPIFRAIGDVAKVVFDAITAYVMFFFRIYKFIFETIYYIAVFIWQQIYNFVIKPYIDMIIDYVRFLVKGIEIYLGVLLEIFRVVWSAIWFVIHPVIDLIWQGMQWAWGIVVGIWSSAVGFFNGIWDSIKKGASNVASSVKGFFSGLFDGLVSALKSTANFFIGTSNDLINSYNNTVGRIPKVPHIPNIPKLATGIENFVGGMAYVHQGEVLTYLPPGSNVIPKNEVEKKFGNKTVTTNINGDIKIDSPQDADYFFKRLDRNQQLVNMGLSPNG